MVLNNVQCDGSESHLVNCTHLVTQNCSMLETAGVLCKPACQYNGQVNLYGGRSNNEGRVEICMNNQWGTVCDVGFDDGDASVVCKTLGLPFGGR